MSSNILMTTKYDNKSTIKSANNIKISGKITYIVIHYYLIQEQISNRDFILL
jgi:uncharacterized protein YgiM (DUF1202 family)